MIWNCLKYRHILWGLHFEIWIALESPFQYMVAHFAGVFGFSVYISAIWTGDIWVIVYLIYFIGFGIWLKDGLDMGHIGIECMEIGGMGQEVWDNGGNCWIAGKVENFWNRDDIIGVYIVCVIWNGDYVVWMGWFIECGVSIFLIGADDILKFRKEHIINGWYMVFPYKG